MTAANLFFIFSAIAISGIIYAGYNVYSTIKNGINSDMDVFKVIGKHLAAAMVVSLSGICAVVSGIVWIVHQF